MRRILYACKARFSTATFAAVIVCLTAMSAVTLVGCSSDSVEEPTPKYENGVKIIGETLVEVNAAQNAIIKTVETDGAYTTSTEETWIKIISKGSADKAGKYGIRMQIERNETGAQREGTVYITVDGFSTVKLVTVKQIAVGSKDPVIQYIDERLSTEYLWLDEYNDKRPTFNYSLKFDAFIEKSLLSLTTNIEDGGKRDGERYLFTNMQYLGNSSPYGSTRAGQSEFGLGLVMSGFPIRVSNTNIALTVEHVYQGSPAAKAGVKRGDWIIKYNNSEITASNYANVWNQLYYGTASATIVKRTAFSDAEATISITAGDYDPNPVACYKILNLKNYPDFDGKKIGYLAYLGFEYEYRQELVDAFTYFKNQNITDLIIDLTPNGGGEVYTSNYLVSMIINESFVGQFYGDMRRHPKNEEGDTDMYIEGETDDTPAIQLPHLGLEKVYFLTTDNTASASEATIAGLRGLDIDAKVVGNQFTHGKNCGMDTETLKIGNGWYYFAPITFRIFNAKGWNDYADGIPADVNIDEFYSESGLNQGNPKDVAFYYFPIPMAEWDNFFFNPALNAALADMIGKSAKTDDIFGVNGSASSSTRAASLEIGQPMPQIKDERQQTKSGMYVTKESLERHKKSEQ